MTWIGPDYDNTLGIVLPGLTAISFPRQMTDADIQDLITAFPHLAIYFDGAANFNTATNTDTSPTGGGTGLGNGLGAAIFRILSLAELADAQIVRLRVPTTNGNYEEVGTRLDTLARFIRHIADGDNWRTEIGFAADTDSPKRRMTIDENGFPDFN